MIASLRREGALHLALASMGPKQILVYNWASWASVLQNVIGMAAFVYFWRSVYANTQTIAGLTLGATLTYILLARVFEPLAELSLVAEFGWGLREGGLAQELVRPLDLQLTYYVLGLGNLAAALGRQLPAVLLATFAFGLRWPTDPAVWAVFVLSALLGRSVIFLVDWILGCLTFYTTEVWGLWGAAKAVTLFLTGGLLPLAMLPDGLRVIVQASPFAQAIYWPVSLLSGLTPLSEAPRLLLVQALWLVGLVVLSRWFFRVAVRRITVQGG